MSAADREYWSCLRKTVFPKRKEALVEAGRLRRVTGENIRAYHCRYCGDFHVGHPKGESMRQHKLALAAQAARPGSTGVSGRSDA